MGVMLTHVERRDGIDRVDLAEAAFDLCRAYRGADGIRNARFFWETPDRIVLLVEAETMADLDGAPKPDVARALFHLADLGRIRDEERWYDPAIGEETYRMAGR